SSTTSPPIISTFAKKVDPKFTPNLYNISWVFLALKCMGGVEMLVRRMQWLICCLLLSISLGLPSQAQGKELNPTAYLQNVEGEVMVQKGGGLREFRAFEGMPIQQ